MTTNPVYKNYFENGLPLLEKEFDLLNIFSKLRLLGNFEIERKETAKIITELETLVNNQAGHS